jgi:hypothetical protein
MSNHRNGEQLHQSNSQTYLNSKSDSYSYKRDSHKVHQIQAKNTVGNGVTVVRNEEGPSGVRSKVEAKGSKGAYTNKYMQRMMVDEVKAKMRESSRYARGVKKQPSKAESRPKSVSNKLNSKSMNQASTGSMPKVMDLKEMRDKEKHKKQARIGLMGGQMSSMLSNSNFSNMSKNYAANISNFKNQNEFDASNKTAGKIYNSHAYHDDENLSYRSYTHLSSQKQVQSDGKYQIQKAHISGQSEDDGVLMLRKQMLNQEYLDLEKQRQNMKINEMSPMSNGSRGQPSRYNTPYDIYDDDNPVSGFDNMQIKGVPYHNYD